MYLIKVSNFDEWRIKARNLLHLGIPPTEIMWQDLRLVQGSLFSEEEPQLVAPTLQKTFVIPKQFLPFAELISYHRDNEKWSKLYEVLWRITHGEKQLLLMSTDVLISHLLLMQKAVSRDAHKMKAFVRFCTFKEDSGEEQYLAWYKPDHLIVRYVAPFFQRRFAVMSWTIITPDETVHWNGQELLYREGKIITENPTDELEHLWQTYYRAIFNPARIKIKAMKREMPVRYWHNLPETKMIPGLLEEAPKRVEQMLKHQEGLNSSAADFLPSSLSIPELKDFARNCNGCSLYQNATQTVFGVGNTAAKLLIVGEQPGDKEDLLGEPFVGPAGQLFKASLKKLGIDSHEIYITNAVKHFKFAMVRGRREHRSPSIHEVTACKPWLLAEIASIKPKVILCLGLTAAKSLINPAFHIKKDRGKLINKDTYIITATYHPSAILRAVSAEMTHDMLALFESDLLQAYNQSQR